MEFYAECQKYGIADWSDTAAPDKHQRVELLAQKHKISYGSWEELGQIFAQRKSLYETITRQKHDATLSALKKSEQERFQRLTFYSMLHGTEEPVTMMKDKADAYRADAKGVSFLPTRKESDGAILAGLSYGMGGPVPAMMSLSSTARNNADIRQYNQRINDFNALAAQGQMAALQLADSWDKQREKISVKLIGDLTPEEVLKNLTFSNTKVTVSQSGTVTVTTEVTASSNLRIFGKTPAYADGSVVAQIYDGKQNIGQAVLVFPVYGSDSTYLDRSHKEDRLSFTCGVYRKREKETTPLEGMCLFCGVPGKTYTVQFTAGDLWAMER